MPVFDFKITDPDGDLLRSGRIAYSDREKAREELRNRLATRRGSELTVPKYGPEFADACKIELSEVKANG
jgi:phage baseplate assembly protein W